MSLSRSELIIIGAGGHATVVLYTALAMGLTVRGFVDSNPRFKGTSKAGYSIIQDIRDFLKEAPHDAVLAVGDNAIRQQLDEQFSSLVTWKTLIHPQATVHDSAQLDPGTVVFAGAVIQPQVRIGKHSVINTAATIDHDCVIGDFVHLAPGVHLAGNITVGTGAFLGIGSVVLPNKKIGDWATVGAGAVLIDHVPKNKTVVGIPARSL